MAHKKAGGSSRNGRDSNSQRLGLKIFGGQHVLAVEVVADGELAEFRRKARSVWHRCMIGCRCNEA